MGFVVSDLTAIFADFHIACFDTKMCFCRAFTWRLMTSGQLALQLTASILTEGALLTTRMALLFAIVYTLVAALESTPYFLSFIDTVSAHESARMIRLLTRMLIIPFCVILVIFPQ